eukprot:SAG11_NODE_2049_length_3883_cov_5.318446_2_plen_150_part_00
MQGGLARSWSTSRSSATRTTEQCGRTPATAPFVFCALVSECQRRLNLGLGARPHALSDGGSCIASRNHIRSRNYAAPPRDAARPYVIPRCFWQIRVPIRHRRHDVLLLLLGRREVQVGPVHQAAVGRGTLLRAGHHVQRRSAILGESGP